MSLYFPGGRRRAWKCRKRCRCTRDRCLEICKGTIFTEKMRNRVSFQLYKMFISWGNSKNKFYVLVNLFEPRLRGSRVLQLMPNNPKERFHICIEISPAGIFQICISECWLCWALTSSMMRSSTQCGHKNQTVHLKVWSIFTDNAFINREMKGKTIEASAPSGSGLETKLSMKAIVLWRTGKHSDSESNILLLSMVV